jgi:thiosulfate dehydrogenase [quinone] large subunit
MLGVAGASVFGLLLLKAGSSPNLPQPLPITYTQNAVTQPSPATYIQNAVTHAQLLANASNIQPDQALTLNDPTVGQIVLIHLDNGQFVAYSTTCTHAGCQVQFDPSSKDLICPCHGAVYDPYNNAQVLAGPAPFPLQSIPIQYDSSTGNIYLNN